MFSCRLNRFNYRYNTPLTAYNIAVNNFVLWILRILCATLKTTQSCSYHVRVVNDTRRVRVNIIQSTHVYSRYCIRRLPHYYYYYLVSLAENLLEITQYEDYPRVFLFYYNKYPVVCEIHGPAVKRKLYFVRYDGLCVLFSSFGDDPHDSLRVLGGGGGIEF